MIMEPYYEKFPDVLKNALKENKVTFPTELQKRYKDIDVVYRGIRLVKGKKESIDRTDFLSQAERKLPDTDYEDIGSYSCSCFEDLEELELAFKLSRKNKAIAIGRIREINGPIWKNKEDSHIHWFLYKDANAVEDFHIKR